MLYGRIDQYRIIETNWAHLHRRFLSTTGKNCIWGYLNSSIGQYNATVDFMSNSAGVTLTSGATAWTAASDEPLKDITGTFDTAL